MIAKRIGKKKRRPAAREIGRSALTLSRYVVQSSGDTGMAPALRLSNYLYDVTAELMGSQHVGEKVEFYGARNLPGDDPNVWAACLAASAMRARGHNDPLDHWVISWRENEHPDFNEIERAIDLFDTFMNTDELHAVWAVHSNTNYRHLHIALSRVDPLTGKMRLIADGWEQDRAQQFCAMAAHTFNRSAEVNDHYAVDPEGRLLHRKSNRVALEPGVPFVWKKDEREQDLEKAQASPAMIALREALLGAASWEDLHMRVALQQSEFRKLGSGAIIIQRDRRLKASDIDPKCSFGALTKRLGQYRDPPHRPNREAYVAYSRALRNLADDVRAAKKRAHSGLDQLARSGADISAMRSAIDAAYADAFAAISTARMSEYDWKTRGQPSLPAITVPGTLERPQMAGSGKHEPRVDTQLPRAIFDRTGKPLLMINEKSILVLVRDDKVIQHALAIAIKYWGTCSATGSPEFVAQVNRVARVMGLEIGADGISQRQVDERKSAVEPSTSRAKPVLARPMPQPALMKTTRAAAPGGSPPPLNLERLRDLQHIENWLERNHWAGYVQPADPVGLNLSRAPKEIQDFFARYAKDAAFIEIAERAEKRMREVEHSRRKDAEREKAKREEYYRQASAAKARREAQWDR